MKYINLKLRSGIEVSVYFTVYSNAHKIAGSFYNLSLSEEPLYSTVFEKGQDVEWQKYNIEVMFGEVIPPIIPELPEIIPPFAPISPSPATNLYKGSGALDTAVIVDGGTGYKFGDIIHVSGGVKTAPTLIRVTAVGAEGAITTASVRQGGVYTTPPTNPCATEAGNGNNGANITTGTGATFNLTYRGTNATSMYAGVSKERTDAAFDYWGSDVKDSTSGYRGNGTGNGTQFKANWVTDSPKFEIKLAGLNTICELYVDGLRVGTQSVTTDSSGASYVYLVDWGGERKSRSYSLAGVNSAFGGLNLGSSSDTLSKPPRTRKFVWQMGDSYTFGTEATQPSFNDFRIMCDHLGVDGLADGIGGSGWTSTGERIPATRVTNKLLTLSRVPDYIIFSLGYNDSVAGRVEELKTNMDAALEIVKTNFPTVPVILIGPATPQGETEAINKIRTAVMEQAEKHSLKFVDVQGWITKENAEEYTSHDLVHPNDAGYARRGSLFASFLKDTIV